MQMRILKLSIFAACRLVVVSCNYLPIAIFRVRQQSSTPLTVSVALTLNACSITTITEGCSFIFMNSFENMRIFAQALTFFLAAYWTLVFVWANFVYWFLLFLPKHSHELLRLAFGHVAKTSTIIFQQIFVDSFIHCFTYFHACSFLCCLLPRYLCCHSKCPYVVA